MTEITTRPVPQAPPSPPPRPPARKRGLLDHSLVQLTLVVWPLLPELREEPNNLDVG